MVGAWPLIGVTTYLEQASWGVWSEPAALLPASYVRAVQRASGVPLLLPPGPPEAAADAAAGLDALVISGGPDVDPAAYGAERDQHTGPSRPERDAWELALIDAALRADLPLLGICRGMQLLNVARGGSLVQHLPDRVGHDGHCPVPGQFGAHDVSLLADGPLAGLYGAAATVPTHHHQAADRLGAGVVAVGWAADGTVEAVKHPQEGAGVITSLTETDGLAELADDATSVEPGAIIGFLSYASLIN
jgi:putative glutamine amidotransferase